MQIPNIKNNTTINLKRFNALNLKKGILVSFCYKNALEVVLVCLFYKLDTKIQIQIQKIWKD